MAEWLRRVTLKHSDRGSSPVSDDEHYKIKKVERLIHWVAARPGVGGSTRSYC